MEEGSGLHRGITGLSSALDGLVVERVSAAAQDCPISERRVPAPRTRRLARRRAPHAKALARREISWPTRRHGPYLASSRLPLISAPSTPLRRIRPYPTDPISMLSDLRLAARALFRAKGARRRRDPLPCPRHRRHDDCLQRHERPRPPSGARRKCHGPRPRHRGRTVAPAPTTPSWRRPITSTSPDAIKVSASSPPSARSRRASPASTSPSASTASASPRATSTSWASRPRSAVPSPPTTRAMSNLQTSSS